MRPSFIVAVVIATAVGYRCAPDSSFARRGARGASR